MRFSLDPARTVNLLSDGVSLCAGTPLLNGAPLAAAHLVSSTPREVIWQAETVRFGLEITPGDEMLALRWWVEGAVTETLDSFGLRFAQVRNAQRVLHSGYFSWDGSRYLDLDGQSAPITGYALVQFLPRTGGGSLVAGFDRHDRFQQSFTVDASGGVPALEILTLWDRRHATDAGRCSSERLLCFAHPQVEEALRVWAQAVGEAAPLPPRAAPPITGWCSWYSLYAAIDEERIRHHLRTAAAVAARENLPLRVFQIDDGFTPEMGDWLDVKPQFPRGMAPLLEEIRAAGFVPGLWIAPFMVGNRSRLYAAHPDWVVRDRQTGGPLAQMRFYGEFRWHKRSEEYYILDATHPGAFAYLRHVFRTWRRDWGCEYFKTDFMHFGSEHGPDRALWHTPGRTRIEIWRSVAALIREEIGDALWLGCGCPLWAPVGLVDAVRIGRDIGTEWSGGAQSVLHDGAARNFANRILWQADPDCLLLRTRFHNLTDAELRALALYAGMMGGLLLTSDDLAELPPERIALFKQLLTANPTPCRFPLLGSNDPVLLQVRRLDATRAALLLFNTGDRPAQRSHALAALNLPGHWDVAEWDEHAPDAPQPLAAHTDRIDLTLAPHTARLLLLTTA